MDKPLRGLLVADFSRVLAGPLVTQTLGDLGADIVKVERPDTGDDTRHWGPPFREGESTYYLGLNRNKRSVAFDLGDESDRRLARRLCERADVLVENFRPGTMERFGFGYDALHELNPQLVYCSISGFGTSGEAAELPGYDFLVQAVSGLMSITGEHDGPPMKVGVALVDMICGLYATTGILAALRSRDAVGAGQLVEVSLMDAALAALLNQGSAYLMANEVPQRCGNRHPSIAPYQTFRAADRRFALAVGSDSLWQRLCQCLERPDFTHDDRFATNSDRVANIDALEEELDTVFVRAPADEWIHRFRQAGIPAGPVNDVAEAFEYAKGLGLDPVITAEGDTEGLPFVRLPVHLPDMPARVERRPPRLGEHSADIRAWLEAEP